VFNFFSKKKSVGMGSLPANDAVRTKLSEMGDDGSAARHVIHFAFPLGAATVEDVTAIKRHLAKLGFKVKNSVSEAGLSFENHQPVTGQEFDQLTSDLAQYFDGFDWEYDGWECAVVAN
jgi:regulator of ribonuclease activity B